MAWFENIDNFIQRQVEIKRREDAWEDVSDLLSTNNSRIFNDAINDLEAYVQLKESHTELANFAEKMDDFGGDVVLWQLLKKFGDIWAWLLSYFKFRKHIKINQLSRKEKWRVYQPIIFDYLVNRATNKLKSSNNASIWKAAWVIADAWIDQMSKANKAGADVFDQALKNLEERLRYRWLKQEDLNLPYDTIEKLKNRQITYIKDLPEWYKRKHNL